MELKSGEVVQIVYLNEGKGEITQRRIIPTFVPKQTIKSIDITELSPQEQLKMMALYREYADYYEGYMNGAFNFETWVEHTKGETVEPKWRAFKLANIKDVA